MNVDDAGPSTQGVRLRLFIIAAALFAFLTVEMFPVGAQPQLRVGLSASAAGVGLLTTVHAGVAALAAIPSVYLTRHWNRRTAGAVSLGSVALAQIGMALAALAPVEIRLEVALGLRAIGAVGHVLVWSQLPIIAVWLMPDAPGRATATAYLGAAAGLVAGSPLVSAIAQLLGWQTAAIALGVFAGLIALAAYRFLPADPAAAAATVGGTLPPAVWRMVWLVCAAAVLLVTSHYLLYPYLAELAAEIGIEGAGYSLLLVGCGVAGLVTTRLAGRLLDEAPRATIVGTVAAFAGALVGIAVLGAPALVLILALLWCAAFAVIPVLLQVTIVDATAPAPQRPAAYRVLAFQIGIGGGAALGGAMLPGLGVSGLAGVAAAGATAGLVLVLVARRTFGGSGGRRQVVESTKPVR